MGRLAREPLLHFLLLGAALFGLHRALAGPGAGAGAAGEIVVSRGRIAAIAETFERTWQRPPTEGELAGLVDDFVRDEVLYREAVALGLDRDDTVVRRRMRQKLEFLAEDAGGAPEPTEADLAAHLAAHAELYRRADRLTFTQVFLDPTRRGAAVAADAEALLAALRERPASVDVESAGDGLLLAPRYVDAADADVAREFGDAFAASLRGAPVGAWLGPLRSGYGLHLVRVEARTPGGPAELAEVRDAVARDWAAARREAALDAQYARWKSAYRIRVEPAP